MARPRRAPGARQIGAWLSPQAFETLAELQQRFGFPNRTATIEAIATAYRKWLDNNPELLMTEAGPIEELTSREDEDEKDEEDRIDWGWDDEPTRGSREELWPWEPQDDEIDWD